MVVAWETKGKGMESKGKIVILDYGMGNIGSILNIFKSLNIPAIASNQAQDIERAEKLILPGVGAFDHGMRQLKSSGLIDLLSHKVLEDKIPILGICLGMQLLAESSEEGKSSGLGWVPAKVVRFKSENSTHLDGMRVPHMGWNSVKIQKQSQYVNSQSDAQSSELERFYFVHSYYMQCKDNADVLMTTDYYQEFTSAVERGNILGVQFHPEKSHRFGKNFLKRFAHV